MKKLTNILLLSVAFLLMTACSEENLPQRSQDFINKYFPENSIVLVEVDDEEDAKEYEVWLNDGTKIEFDMQGEWYRVSRKKSGVPASMMPAPIVQYIQTNYAGNVVTKYSRKDYGYKVELSDDIDLRFTKQYQFIEEVD